MLSRAPRQRSVCVACLRGRLRETSVVAASSVKVLTSFSGACQTQQRPFSTRETQRGVFGHTRVRPYGGGISSHEETVVRVKPEWVGLTVEQLAGSLSPVTKARLYGGSRAASSGGQWNSSAQGAQGAQEQPQEGDDAESGASQSDDAEAADRTAASSVASSVASAEARVDGQGPQKRKKPMFPWYDFPEQCLKWKVEELYHRGEILNEVTAKKAWLMTERYLLQHGAVGARYRASSRKGGRVFGPGNGGYAEAALMLGDTDEVAGADSPSVSATASSSE